MRTSRWGLARWGLALWGWFQDSPLVIECVPTEAVGVDVAHADHRSAAVTASDHRSASLTPAAQTDASLTAADSINVTVEVQ